MSKEKVSMTTIILNFFEQNKGRVIESKEVYDMIARAIPLTAKQLEKYYDRPRFQHSVRATLMKLTRSRKIVHVEKGHYKFNDKYRNLEIVFQKFLKKTKATTIHKCFTCGKTIYNECYYKETDKDPYLQTINARDFCESCYSKFGNKLLNRKLSITIAKSYNNSKLDSF